MKQADVINVSLILYHQLFISLLVGTLEIKCLVKTGGEFELEITICWRRVDRAF